MRDFFLSVVIFVEARGSLMSCIQTVSFSLGINTRRECVWMSHPIQVFRLTSCTSPEISQSDRGSSHFRGPQGCSGLNMVWMTNKTAFLA